MFGENNKYLALITIYIVSSKFNLHGGMQMHVAEIQPKHEPHPLRVQNQLRRGLLRLAKNSMVCHYERIIVHMATKCIVYDQLDLQPSETSTQLFPSIRPPCSLPSSGVPCTLSRPAQKHDRFARMLPW